MPSEEASATRFGSISMPSTLHPAAAAIWTASNPSRPSPMTATFSPICGSASRKPCMAMAPSVVNAADSKSTFFGRGVSRLRGTTLYSAWTAKPPPAQATRWPTLKPCMSFPSAVIVPADEYPSAIGWSRRLNAACMVGTRPSCRALSITCLTRSGRERALPTRFFSANSTTMRSVPADTRLAAVLTNANPARGVGTGTSSTIAFPFFIF